MKKSLRAQAKQRRYKRFNSTSKLNLVSLMDIFTILVFFLMVNQSEVRVLQNNKALKLPVSVAEQLPNENIVITVFHHSVLVQEREIWQRDSVNINNEPLLESEIQLLSEALKKELAYQSSKRSQLTAQEVEKGRAVTIIGDSTIEYSVLKQIMAMCAETDYRNISLAVEQTATTKTEE